MTPLEISQFTGILNSQKITVSQVRFKIKFNLLKIGRL